MCVKMITKIKLETGDLVIDSDEELDTLSGFAARNNSKRGFLFLSKVLGKHYPSCPCKMKELHDSLARNIKPKLQKGSTVVIGFSETATALGYGVYEALGIENSYYQHTTRHKINYPLFLKFSESHSHASSHFLYYPDNPKHQQILRDVANIVFVDDEYTTGNTLLNIINAFREKDLTPNFIATSILDWTNGSNDGQLPSIVSIIKGNFVFIPNQLRKCHQKFVSENLNSITHLSLSNLYGRIGCESLKFNFEKLIKVIPTKNDRVLVIGTGEFMNVAYLLALFLKTYSPEVYVQSTTRSPIIEGNDVISVLTFKDNYAEETDNFLYNVKDKRYDLVYICYETNYSPPEHTLYDQLAQLFPRVIRLIF